MTVAEIHTYTEQENDVYVRILHVVANMGVMRQRKHTIYKFLQESKNEFDIFIDYLRRAELFGEQLNKDILSQYDKYKVNLKQYLEECLKNE